MDLIRIFGWLGIPMLLAFTISALWMSTLAVIQMMPSAAANALMGTGAFDFGEFWILPIAEPQIAVPSTMLISMFAIGYSYLALAMIFPAKLVGFTGSSQGLWSRVRSGRPNRVHCQPSKRTGAWKSTETINRISPEKNPWWRRTRHYSKKLTNYLDANKDSAILALPKLIFQTTTLLTYLKEGFPLVLIFTYATLLLCNWTLSALRSIGKREDPLLMRTRIFDSFDLFFAVFAPLHVLVFACNAFTFDHAVFETRVATLSADAFDHTARLFADPTETSLFGIAFKHLQLTSATTLFIKCVLNGFTIFRWYRTIVQLIHRMSVPSNMCVVSVAGRTHDQIDESTTPKASRRAGIVRNSLLALTFLGVGIGIFVYTIVAVVSSRHVCVQYPQCKVPSYAWNLRATHCACIVFVQRETAVMTITEWADPPDVTYSLAQLAHTGHLKIVQIINHQLPHLPPELRFCRGLQQLILIYTKTLAIPDWAKEFSSLEYLHIEGDVTPKQLSYIPKNLFENMPRLVFLHLGCHLKLPLVPDLNNLTRLQYLALAMLHMISEVPPMDNLKRLRKLSLVDVNRLVRLPPLHALRNLNTVALSYRTAVCCNGFLTGSCDLLAFSCRDRTAQGEPPVVCATDRIAAEDLAVLESTEGRVCPPNLPFDLKDVAPTYETTDIMCGGIMYKECRIGDTVGMCFPARMQPVSCQLDHEYLNMRRLQIQRGVGDPCNADVEAWLGCNLN